MTKELIFIVEEDPDEGYTAKALGESIFTEANDIETLKIMIKDAMLCHYDNPEDCPTEDCPKIIRLHIVKDEVFAL